jgi:hypothetical protein
MATSAARQVARLQQTNLGVKALGKSPVRGVKAASGMTGQQGLTVGIGAMQFWLGSRAHTGGYQRWELRRRRRHDNGRERRFHAFRGGGAEGPPGPQWSAGARQFGVTALAAVVTLRWE